MGSEPEPPYVAVLLPLPPRSLKDVATEGESVTQKRQRKSRTRRKISWMFCCQPPIDAGKNKDEHHKYGQHFLEIFERYSYWSEEGIQTHFTSLRVSDELFFAEPFFLSFFLREIAACVADSHQTHSRTSTAGMTKVRFRLKITKTKHFYPAEWALCLKGFLYHLTYQRTNLSSFKPSFFLVARSDSSNTNLTRGLLDFRGWRGGIFAARLLTVVRASICGWRSAIRELIDSQTRRFPNSTIRARACARLSQSLASFASSAHVDARQATERNWWIFSFIYYQVGSRVVFELKCALKCGSIS